MKVRDFTIAGVFLAAVFSGCANDPAFTGQYLKEEARALNDSARTYSRAGHHPAACDKLYAAIRMMEEAGVPPAAANTSKEAMLSLNKKSSCLLSSMIKRLPD